MRYSIEGQELTDIADALRRRHGETEWITVTEAQPVAGAALHSNNMTGFGEFTDELLEGSSASIYSKYTTVEIPDGKAKVKYCVSKMSFMIYAGSTSGELLFQISSTEAQQPVIGEIILEAPVLVFRAVSGDHGSSNAYYAEVYMMDADGNYKETVDVEVEREIKNTYKSSEMAQAIDDIPLPPPEEAFVYSGDCKYRFSYLAYNWMINLYGDKITTNQITDSSYMFFINTEIEEIPFDFNFAYPHTTYNHTQATYMFNSNQRLKKIGKLINWYPNSVNNIFNSCYCLRELPELVNPNWTRLQTYQYANCGAMFQNCYSLRSIPESWLKNLWGIQTSTSHPFYYMFAYCYSLDEIRGLSTKPIKGTSNMFGNGPGGTFSYCGRLKDVIFETNEDGTAVVTEWKNQSVNLLMAGWVHSSSYLLNHNSGCTLADEVKDDATYQANKDNPNWWSTKIPYSRYNHDSAVRTINSLPDTSAYLATAGGTNTITFNEIGGELTDGGACGTLTAEEIAVAAAKGWTVTFAKW